LHLGGELTEGLLAGLVGGWACLGQSRTSVPSAPENVATVPIANDGSDIRWVRAIASDAKATTDATTAATANGTVPTGRQ
jgi:hypothetical protein